MDFRPGNTRRMSKNIIVEVEGYEGEVGSIIVTNDEAPSEPPRIYCIGQIGEDGILRFIDWGYATAAEAEEALPGWQRA